MLIEISKEQEFIIANKYLLTGQLELRSGCLTVISGENGIGKSTLFEYLKINRDLFEGQKLNFLNQNRLTPLNEISGKQALDQLECFKDTESNTFEYWKSYVEPFLEQPIRNLSGGQNQMLKILLTLYVGGDIFLFDEPLHFLDKRNKLAFIKLIKLLKEEGKAIVLIEHQIEHFSDITDLKYELSFIEENLRIVKC